MKFSFELIFVCAAAEDHPKQKPVSSNQCLPAVFLDESGFDINLQDIIVEGYVTSCLGEFVTNAPYIPHSDTLDSREIQQVQSRAKKPRGEMNISRCV